MDPRRRPRLLRSPRMDFRAHRCDPGTRRHSRPLRLRIPPRASAGRAFRVAIVGLRLVTVRGPAARGEGGCCDDTPQGLRSGLAGFTWITSAVLFTMVEDVGPHGRVSSSSTPCGGHSQPSPQWATETSSCHRSRPNRRRLHHGRRHFNLRHRSGKLAEYLVRSDREDERDEDHRDRTGGHGEVSSSECFDEVTVNPMG